MTADVPISVITPVFETGSLLYETMESLYRQTFQEFEWILVDDGSGDQETQDCLRHIENRDKRVKVIHHEKNAGLSAARNSGITHSSGKFLFFIDSDDLIDPTCLEKCYLLLNLHSAFAFVNTFVKGFGSIEYLWKGGFHNGKDFLQENFNTSCFMARREVFNSVRFDETMRDGCEDWDFWLKAATQGFWGYTIPEYLFYYRRKEVSRWPGISNETIRKKIRQRVLQLYSDHFAKRGFPQPQFQTYRFGHLTPDLPAITYSKPTGKNILCIFPWLEIGGADQFNIHLLEGLSRHGWSITIITTKPSEHPLEKKFKEITPDIFHVSNLGEEDTYISIVKYLIVTRQISLVFLSNSMAGYYMLPWLKQEFSQLPVVDYTHCEDPGWYGGGYPFFSVMFKEFIDTSFVTSAQLRNWCIAKGGDADRISICYINVDTDKIQHNAVVRNRIRKELGVPNETPLLIYVARLTQQKQPLLLADTLQELRKRQAGFRCLLIGDGPDKSLLMNRIHRLGLQEYILFKGYQEHEKVLDYMDAADIFFLPSLYEGIALSVYEAMAKGLAVVSSNTGGQNELVTEDCGILIGGSAAESSAKEYARALETLINDHDKMRHMGLNGRKRVEKYFRLKDMVERTDEALSSVSIKVPSALAYQNAYRHVFDRLHQLERYNEENTSNHSGIAQFLVKHQQSVQRLRKAYHKIKKIIKNESRK